jgi:propanol-preferring alcohol dehydrogenase
MEIPEKMRAMIFEKPGQPLRLVEIPIPKPAANQVLIHIEACGVCRTDLHIIDGELPYPTLPLIPGHEIVGTVAALGKDVEQFHLGDRVGVPWLGWTCGECRYCQIGQENLCDQALFTGYTLPGGYAEFTVADQRYCFSLPATYQNLEAAPLLCAGLIGYRAYRFCGENVDRLGIYGFGAAAHIITQIAIHQDKQVYAFTRPGDDDAQVFARQLGAAWAGDSTTPPPISLDAAIIFAPVGTLVPSALRAVRKGGTVVAGGIHMSDIPGFPYNILWGERSLRSVANLTRQDGKELLALASQFPIHMSINRYPLEQVNLALDDLRKGRLQGAVVLEIK